MNSSPDQSTQLLTLEQAAEQLAFDKRTLYREIAVVVSLARSRFVACREFARRTWRITLLPLSAVASHKQAHHEHGFLCVQTEAAR
jgi:hypothetical protein